MLNELSEEVKLMKGTKQVKNFKILDRQLYNSDVGVVFLGKDISQNGKLIFVKVVDFTINDIINKSAKNELNAFSKIKHPLFATIVGFERTKSNFYSAYEYANGGSLNDLIEYFFKKHNHGIPEGLIQAILIQILQGLDYMKIRKLEKASISFDEIYLHFSGNNMRMTYEDYELNKFEGLEVKFLGLCFEPTLRSRLTGKYLNTSELAKLGGLIYKMMIGVFPEFFFDKEQSKLHFFSYPEKCMISAECITLINLLLLEGSSLKDSQIRESKFIIGDPSRFNTVVLKKIQLDKLDFNNTEIRNAWAIFSNEGEKQAEMLTTDDMKDEDLMKSICAALPEEKRMSRDLLSRFRLGREKHNKMINEMPMQDTVSMTINPFNDSEFEVLQYEPFDLSTYEIVENEPPVKIEFSLGFNINYNYFEN